MIYLYIVYTSRQRSGQCVHIVVPISSRSTSFATLPNYWICTSTGTRVMGHTNSNLKIFDQFYKKVTSKQFERNYYSIRQKLPHFSRAWVQVASKLAKKKCVSFRYSVVSTVQAPCEHILKDVYVWPYLPVIWVQGRCHSSNPQLGVFTNGQSSLVVHKIIWWSLMLYTCTCLVICHMYQEACHLQGMMSD